MKRCNTIVLLFIGVMQVNCGPGTNPPLCQVQTPGANLTVHSFGDSITAGAGASNFCLGYQADFTNSIKANGDDEGISGSTLEQEMPSILAMNPNLNDVTTLLPGFNDVSQFGDDPDHLLQFQFTLTQAIGELASKSRILMVGTTMYATEQMQSQYIPLHTNEAVDLYVEVIKQIVAQVNLPNVILVDTNHSYDPNTMSSNNYHPDDYGHRVIANLFVISYSNYQNQ
jgi:lysophospholipase L1-like esterase